MLHAATTFRRPFILDGGTNDKWQGADVSKQDPRSPQEKWNRLYAQGRRSRLHPTLVQYLPWASVGRALDIACGTGENALYLAQQGFHVDALDISEVALRQAQRQARARGLPVHFIVCDAVTFSYPPNTYDLVLNFYFLERRIFPLIARTLKPGGLLIFETFNWRHRRVRPEANPAHLLRPGELGQAFTDLGFHILTHKEEDNRTTLVARKPKAP